MDWRASLKKHINKGKGCDLTQEEFDIEIDKICVEISNMQVPNEIDDKELGKMIKELNRVTIGGG